MHQNSNHIKKTGAQKHLRNQCDLFSAFRESQSHVDPGRGAKSFIFQQKEKEGAACPKTMRTLENAIYQSITNTVATGRTNQPKAEVQYTWGSHTDHQAL